MKTKKRQKLCHNCEGDVDLDVIVCPFCAADLREERKEQPFSNPYLSAEFPSTSSLYPPRGAKEEPLEVEREPEESSPKEAEEASPIWPLLLGSLGCQMFLFGLFLLFFSQDGELVFRWDAAKWYLYFLFSAPLLFFAYQKWKNLRDF